MNTTPTCRPMDGGHPRCKLALLNPGPKTVEIKGNNFENIYNSQLQGYNSCKPIPVLGENQYDVMIIGEAPGMDDDAIGLPFQGRAGEFVTKFLAASGLNLDRVYLTLMTKCRPPKGRKPAVPEIKECRYHLEKEIRALKPKVVMLLGNSALRVFNLQNEGGITTIRGKVFTKKFPGWEDGPDFQVIPSINPSSFLYNEEPGVVRQVIGDYRLANDIVNDVDLSTREPYKTANFKLIESKADIDWLINQLNSVPAFAFDTESTGLPWSKNPLLCMSFCWDYSPDKTTVALLPFYQHDPDGSPFKIKPFSSPEFQAYAIEELRKVFKNPAIDKIAHNIKYDANAVHFHLSIDVAGFWWDTMVMHHLLNEKKPHSLEYLADIEFGYGDYSYKNREIVGHGKVLRCGYDHIPDETLWPYAATDAQACFRLYKLYRQALESQPNLINLYKRESEPLMKELTLAERKGVLINTGVVVSLKDEITEDQDNLLNEMKARVLSLIPQPDPNNVDLFEPLRDFNPLSTPQLKTVVMLMGYGDKIVNQDSPSGFTTNKKILLDLAEKDPFFAKIIKYRNNRKLISTYLDNVINDLEYDGRVRYSFLLHGTETGRLSNRFYHQMPKVNEKRHKAGALNLRDMIIAPQGRKLIYADFSQVELRLLAIIANDKEMLRIFKDPNADIHQATAAEILGLPEHGIGKIWVAQSKFKGYWVEAEINKTNRTEIGKRVNFGLAYGSEGANLVSTGKWVDIHGKEHSLTWDMLNMGMRRWKRRFKGVAEFIDKIADETRANKGIVINRFGRARRFGTRLNDLNPAIRKAAERELVNFPIQGAAGSITNSTIIEIAKIIRQFGLENRIELINTVHDMITYECVDELVVWTKDMVRKVASRPFPELDNESFAVGVGVGQSWTEAELNAH